MTNCRNFKLEDLPEMQQRDILGLYDLGVQLTVGETTSCFYGLQYNKYKYSYDLLDEEVRPQLQSAKMYRLRDKDITIDL